MKIWNGGALLMPVVAWAVLAGAPGAGEARQDTKVASTQAVALPPEAKVVFDKARASYKDVKTYQDKVTLKFEMRAKNGAGEDQNQDDSEEMTFFYGGPKRFAMEHKDFAVVSDGTNQTAHLKFMSQYIQKPAGEGLMDEAKVGPIGILGSLHVPAALLVQPAKYAKQFPLLNEITSVKAEERGGKAGTRVSGKGELPEMPFGAAVPMTIWFAGDTGLVGEVTMDLKPAYEDMMAADLKIEKAMGTISFTGIETNGDIAAEKFVFSPGADDKKVDAFGGEDGKDPQLELVGTACPAFTGQDLEGKSVSLADFKGKVLVLDFWATWCAPCMQMIPKIQELSAEYEGKGVVVLGMNQDTPDAVDTVKSTVEKRKLTFRQFMDKDGAVAEQFKVSGIPCTVIVDGTGMIQWIHTGASPSLKKELSENIDKLLKGESLVKPKEAPKVEEPKDEPKK
jgi:peroxiredoxin